jgi:hypothetical protein
VAPSEYPARTWPPAGPTRVPHVVWHAIGLIVALLLAYAIWRGYQSPDLLLDLAAFRLC